MLIIVFIILVFILYKFFLINKTNNTIIINEIENPSKEEYEQIIDIKLPIVFTNILSKYLKLHKIPANKFETMVKKNGKLLDSIKKNFNKYKIPYNISHTFNINIDSKNDSSIVKQNKHYRLLLFQIIGIKRILLFQPNNNKHFKKDINIFNINLKKYPNLLKLKHIEIILYPGQMIYIPYTWLYCYINMSDCVTIEMTSENIFSKLLKFK